MRLHWKIALGVLLVSTGAFLAGAAYVGPSLRHDITAQILSDLESRLALVRRLYAEQVARGPAGQDLQRWAVSIADGAGTRLTVIAADGTVLADSSLSAAVLSRIENHAGRPEIREAMARGAGSAIRHSETLDRDLIYAARRVEAGGRSVVLRLAAPYEAVDSAVDSVRSVLWGALGLALVLAAGLSLLVSRWVSLPLREMSAATQRIAEGDLSVRVQAPRDGDIRELATSFNRMAERLDDTIQTMEAEREQFRRILTTVHEGILLLDETDRVVVGSRSLAGMFGIDELAMIGKTPLELIRAEGVDRTLNALRRGRREFRTEFSLPGGLEERIFELVAVAVFEGEERRGAVLVVRELTHTRRLEKIRRDFVANVSHELRTPLTSIRGYAETLANQLEGREPLDRFAHNIVKRTEGLTALVNDLLDLSRIERPEFAPTLERTDLAELAEGAAELFAERYAQKDLTLHMELGEFDHHAWADHRLLAQVFSNLLDNAFKYTPAGGEVWLRTAEEDGRIRVEVADTGPGIPEKALSRIFERFYRIDKGRSREQGGTGLGLSIVKHIIERHNGRIGVRNRKEGGTVFWFTLPRHQPAA